MNFSKKPFSAHIFGAFLSLFLFWNSPAHADFKIVTTTGMIAELAKKIGGEQVQVTALMGPGVDPHLYKATQGDVRRLMRADVILYNGLMLEGKMQSIFEKMARKKAVFAISDQLNPNQLIMHGTHPDPHIWFNLQLWQQAGERVLQILQQQIPTQKQQFAVNAQLYFNELNATHKWVKAQIQSIPSSQRVLITAHDAFSYFGQAYGLKVMGLQGISTASEFGLQDIKQLKKIIIKHNIKAVFVESSVSPRFIESVVEGVQAQGHNITIGGKLYSDALGLKGSPAGSYLGMVNHNVSTIVKALK